MNIEYNTVTTHNEDAPDATSTFTHTVNSNSNRLLVVGVTTKDQGNPSSIVGVSSNSKGMTNFGTYVVNSLVASSLFYLLSPDTGSNTITIYLGANRDNLVAISADYYNVKQQAWTSTGQNRDTYGSSLGVSLTPTSTRNILVGILGVEDVGEDVANSGPATLIAQDTSTAHRAAYSHTINGDIGGSSVGWDIGGTCNMVGQAGTFEAIDDYTGDLLIFYSGSSYNTSGIDCKCSRWDVSDYDVVVETWLTKSQLQTLRSNITPGAVGELYKVLGKPTYYDKTWSSENTLRLSPIENAGFDDMREDTYIYVSNITDTPLEGPSGWINVKIEGKISGTGAI